MRTPEDIAKQQATYTQDLVQTELSALPDGYVAGGNIYIEGADVYVGPFVANVNGKRVIKTTSTIINDMDWSVLKTPSTYFHIYVNRYGFWFVDTKEPVTVDGLFGLYRQETNERYMGTVYVDSDGAFSKVISWKRIRAEDIDASTITAEEIATGTITADEIAAGAISASLLEASTEVIIGYSGTGTVTSPNEGDRRVYIDDDEIGFQEYTGGAWTTVNSIKIGGVDSNSLFYPFLQCRGVVNPLADKVNVEYFPANTFKHLTFETDFADQNGDLPDLTTSAIRTTSWSKFGSYSFGSSPTTRGLLQYDDVLTLGNNLGLLSWMNWATITGSGEPLIYTLLYKKAATEYIVIYVSYDSSLEKFKMRFQELSASTVQQDVTIELPFSKALLTTGDHTLGYLLSHTDNKMYIIVDTTVVEGNISPLTITSGATTDNYIRLLTENGYSSNGVVNYQDDIVFSSSDEINPDIFIQHYNHNVPWNTDASAKDLVLKPADGGTIRALSGVTVPVLHVQDQKPSGTNGGAFTSGAWQTRTLNTVLTNTITGASLLSNQITLPAGTYKITSSAPAFMVRRHQIRLQNITDGSTIISGTSEYSNSTASYSQSRSWIIGSITIATVKNLEIQHRCETTNSAFGLGVGCGSGFTVDHETYSDVFIEKIG